MRTADGEDDGSQMNTGVAWKPKCWQRNNLETKGTKEIKEKKEIQWGTETRELEL